jgi:hypothetical protein
MDLCKLGLPLALSTCLDSIWDEELRFLQTQLGTSIVTCTSSPTNPLYGPGQGSSCGPMFYLLIYCMVSISREPLITGATSHSVCHTMSLSILEIFLGITSKYLSDPSIHNNEMSRREVAHTVECLFCLAQHWERFLFSTGGTINLQKSHWYLMAWQ